jgi:hypothetical protein
MPKGSMSTEGETLQVSVLPCNSQLTRYVDFWGLLTNVSHTRFTVSADGPGRPVRFAVHRQPLCPRHVSSWLPHSGETYKYATAASTQKNLERISTYWYAPFCCVCLGCCAAKFRSSRGTCELPCTDVFWNDVNKILHSVSVLQEIIQTYFPLALYSH